MDRKVIRPPQPGAAPLSGAVISGGLVFVAGQTAGDVAGFDEQTHAVMKKLGMILREAGSSYENVLRCNIYLTDIRNRGRMNEIYAKYFAAASPPARTTIECKLADPEVVFEIDCVAAVAAG
jgi:2-iminobutanoate/2-iminopropanoate deaminase